MCWKFEQVLKNLFETIKNNNLYTFEHLEYVDIYTEQKFETRRFVSYKNIRT